MRQESSLNHTRWECKYHIVLVGILGMNPSGFAAQVVALAFGLAASSIFPALMMGIFSQRINRPGAIAGMLAGLLTTLVYIFVYQGWFFITGTNNLPDGAAHWVNRFWLIWRYRCSG